MGGGLGHLMRARYVLHRLKLNEDLKVLTANKMALQIFNPDQVHFIEPDLCSGKTMLAKQLLLFFRENPCDQLFVDVFPNGILGELNLIFNKPQSVFYVGRRMKWANYALKNFEGVSFKKSILLERLEPLHLQFISERSQDLEYWELQNDYLPVAGIGHDSLNTNGYWLIVHSFKREEVYELIQLALVDKKKIQSSLSVYVITDIEFNAPPGVVVFRSLEAWKYFKNATRIYSAAGFNSLHLLAPYKEKVVCRPFLRTYDDQFWRKKNLSF